MYAMLLVLALCAAVLYAGFKDNAETGAERYPTGAITCVGIILLIVLLA